MQAVWGSDACAEEVVELITVRSVGMSVPVRRQPLMGTRLRPVILSRTEVRIEGLNGLNIFTA